MLCYYLGKLKNEKVLHLSCTQNMLQMLLSFMSSVQHISNVMKIRAKVNTMQYQHFTSCSFTVLSNLKALQLSKVGLSTIKYQHSKNLTPWADSTWMQIVCMTDFVHKRCLKCPPFARIHAWRRFLHWSIAVSIMSPGICPCKWFLSFPK